LVAIEDTAPGSSYRRQALNQLTQKGESMPGKTRRSNNRTSRTTNNLNEWTIMFFFASDMELSPLNVSQIKALKDAGYQKGTEVILYFDSNEKGVPTRIFNVNRNRRGNPPETHIGDGRDPYVRNLLDDEIFPTDMDPRKGACTTTLCKALPKGDSMRASDALENFIGYCIENNPAKHYLLLLVGHGQIVANDAFLFDENPASGITLLELGGIMQRFTTKVKEQGGEFELLGLHSCSMSAIEVAYELKGTAKYMMASEGFSYVGSWPYRQLLKKIFNTTEDRKLNDDIVQELIQRVYELSLYNATDFAFSGYSHDLALISLAEDKIMAFMEPFLQLTGILRKGLNNPRDQQFIQLAHLKSQSFWRESYTDIYDFCQCLKENYDENDPVARACSDVIRQLKPKDPPFTGFVVFSDNFGWEYQFAHGLSIYFPWNIPLGPVRKSPLHQYKKYAFSTEHQRGDSWHNFLKEYLKKTMRPIENPTPSVPYDQMMALPYPGLYGSLSNKPGGTYANKPGGVYNKPGGGYADSACICPSIKNFFTTIKLHRTVVVREPSMTRRVENAFEEPTGRNNGRHPRARKK